MSEWLPEIRTNRRAQALLWVLALVFRKRWFVQLRRGGPVYILRTPWEDEA